MSDYDQSAKFYHVDFEPYSHIPQILKQISRIGPKSVLEIPCGAGQNARFISPLCEHLTIADIDSNMLATAEESTRELGNVTVLEADMRDFVAPTPIDLIIVSRESFQLLLEEDDARECLECFARNLSQCGRLFLDIANFYAETRQRDSPIYFSKSSDHSRFLFDWSREIGSVTLERYHRLSDSSHQVDVEFHYRRYSNETVKEEWSRKVSLRKYRYDEIFGILNETGFRIEYVLPNYSQEHVSMPKISEAARFVLTAILER